MAVAGAVEALEPLCPEVARARLGCLTGCWALAAELCVRGVATDEHEGWCSQPSGRRRCWIRALREMLHSYFLCRLHVPIRFSCSLSV